jgi:hypothetical protein
MLKSIIILALICSITPITVQNELQKSSSLFNWNAIKCLMNSTKLITAIKQLIQFVKTSQWSEMIEYAISNFYAIQTAVNQCFADETTLTLPFTYAECIRIYPKYMCDKIFKK